MTPKQKYYTFILGDYCGVGFADLRWLHIRLPKDCQRRGKSPVARDISGLEKLQSFVDWV
jgi:hypothetical protein